MTAAFKSLVLPLPGYSRPRTAATIPAGASDGGSAHAATGGGGWSASALTTDAPPSGGTGAVPCGACGVPGRYPLQKGVVRARREGPSAGSRCVTPRA
jgi:hypothetical protein